MFPYDQASWDVVDGAMFMGWGGALREDIKQF